MNYLIFLSKSSKLFDNLSKIADNLLELPEFFKITKSELKLKREPKFSGYFWFLNLLFKLDRIQTKKGHVRNGSFNRYPNYLKPKILKSN